MKRFVKIYGLASVATLFTVGLLHPIVGATPDPNLSEYSLASGSAPFDVAPGPDGNVWFTENSASGSTNKVGKVTSSGVVTEYDLPTSDAGARNMTSGPDGSMWFSEGNAGQIGKVTMSGTITEYAVPGNADTRGIVAGPDGNVWFSERHAGKIGRITPSGTITDYSIPGGGCPWGIASNAGSLWFTDSCNNQVGKVTTAGDITLYNTTGLSRPMATGPDGNVWFGEFGDQKVGKVAPDGTVTEYNVPIYVEGISAGPDGRMWLSDRGSILASVNLGGSNYTVAETGVGPYGVTVGPDGNIWFAEYSNSAIGRYTIPASAIETSAPNTGDGNGDGIPDAMQPHVTSLLSPVNGKYVTLAVDGCNYNTLATVTPVSDNSAGDSGLSYPGGMVNFTLNCQTGATATVSLYFYGLDTDANFELRKYNSTTKTYANISGATLSKVIIGGQSVIKATYNIVDGGSLDQDGIANGIIIDPVGPAQLPATPDTGVGRSNAGTVIAFGLILASAGMILAVLRMNYESLRR